MKDEYAKIFNTINYGQILITRSTLVDTPSKEFFVNLHFLLKKKMIRIQIAPNKNTLAGLDDLFNSMSHDNAIDYIRSSVSTESEGEGPQSNVIEFNKVARGHLK